MYIIYHKCIMYFTIQNRDSLHSVTCKITEKKALLKYSLGRFYIADVTYTI